MSRIKREIVDCMYDFMVKKDGILYARFVFQEDFVGFQGHFPLQKVLPGVCQILCIQVMLEEWEKRPVYLREVVSAKYVLPVLPGEELNFNCWNNKDSGDDSLWKATVKRGEQKVSEFKLNVSFGERPTGPLPK